MGDKTEISWTDHTFNIWWGCFDAPADLDGFGEPSPECENCYARTFDKRLGGDNWQAAGPRRFFGDAYWAKPLKWNAAAEKTGRRAKVFCASMADWAEMHLDPVVRAKQDAARARLWPLIQRTPWLDWLLLSKRPQNWCLLLPWVASTPTRLMPLFKDPLPNVWLGVTAGVTASMWRVDILRRTPAAKRFISGEPLLEHITADTWNAALCEYECNCMVSGQEGAGMHSGGCRAVQNIDWLIVGDESGHGRRPIDLDAVRTARDAAERHGVKFHFKQWNSDDRTPGKTVHLPVLDGRRWAESS